MDKFKTKGYAENREKPKPVILRDEDLPEIEPDIFDEEGNITEEAFGHVPHMAEHEDAIDAEIEKALLEKMEEADNDGGAYSPEESK